MPSEELRKRLEALNGGPLVHRPPEEVRPPETTERGRRDGGSAAGAAASHAPHAATEGSVALPVSSLLEACLPGAVRIAPGGGLFYYVQRRVGDYAPWAQDLSGQIDSALQSDALAACLRCPAGFVPNRTLFLDLETQGLHNAPLFLIGLLRVETGGTLWCHQLLARSDEEETSVVEAFCEMLRETCLVVTFNGRGFDLPMLRARTAAHAIPLPRITAHLDLLLEARRRYRHHLPDCKLQTLERSICGRVRTDDIPGAEIPPAYREFVRTGDASRLADILRHNLLDLATTAELLARFWGEV